MRKNHLSVTLALALGFISIFHSNLGLAMEKGIYLTQETLEDTATLNHLIEQSKKSGITTMIADLELVSERAKKNAALIKNNGLKYVARIIIFPDGATKEQAANKAIWEKKLNLMKHAVAYGAESIQIDYIRYNTKQGASKQHAIDIAKIVEWFRTRLAEIDKTVPMQIDVFGITSYGPELNIGQDLKLISQHVDMICPMVYPSHFEPYIHHAERPYQTVYDSLKLIKAQFDNKINFKLNPYIELSNYRYPLSQEKKLAYIKAQIKAAEDAGADGWYAWSASNYYDNLFKVLQSEKNK